MSVDFKKFNYTIKAIEMRELYFSVEAVNLENAIQEFHQKLEAGLHPRDSDVGWFEVVEVAKDDE